MITPRQIQAAGGRWLKDALAEKPPGPPLINPLIFLKKLAADPLAFISEAFKLYGDMVHIRVGLSWRMVLLIHPKDVESLLLHNAAHCHKDRMTHFLRFGLGDGLLTSEGEKWKRQRRLIAPSMRKRQIAAYADAMVACAVDAELPDKTRVDVHEVMMHLTLDIVGQTLFGADVGDDARRVGHALEALMGQFMRHARTWRRLVPSWVPRSGPVTPEAQASLDDLDAVLFRVISERRAQGSDARDDLLSLLLAARDEDGSAMDDHQIRDEAVTMFVAGHETTALALSYALWQIAGRPDIEAMLHEELDRVLGGRRATLEDVAALEVTTAIVKEVLRLNPPAWTIGREAIEDFELGGYHISRGTQFLIPVFRVHRDPRWYDDPMAFLPERWLDGLADRLPRFAYFPFGGGPRICIGNHFAMMEAILVLATLAQRATFKRAPGFELELTPSVTLRPVDGVPMDVELRG